MLTNIFKKLQGREAQHRLHMWIRDENVLDNDYHPDLVNPRQEYFQLRMNEMFLKNAREYAREFVPVAIVMSDFLYYSDALSNPTREAVPFLVGPNLISGLENFPEDAPFTLQNIKVQGWAPYRGDDVGLFVGLYRMQINDLLDNLLNVCQGISEHLGQAGLGGYLQFARTLSDSLADLTGMQEIEFRTGGKDEFQENRTGKFGFKNGYRLYLNAAINDFSEDHFWVRDEELFYGENRDRLQRFDKQDYCLLRVESTDERTDYESLDFHKTWLRAHAQVQEDNVDRGHALLMECTRQISLSPDLTEEHQELLIELYTANFEKSKERLAKRQGKGSKTAKKKSSHRGVKTAGNELMNLVARANKKGIDAKNLKGLNAVASNIDALFDGEDSDAALDSVTINQQMARLKELKRANKVENRVPSADLVDALSAGLFG